MILGGKLPGKVGRCRFLFCKLFLQYRGKIAVMLSFFLLATSLLSESMVSFDPLCGIAARKETMKLAGLRLRVIWTLPVFSYLNLDKIERKNWARSVKRVCLFSYLNLGKIERKNWARSVKRVRASFLLPWFTHDRDKKLRAGARSLRRAPFYLPKYFYYVGDIAWQYLRNIDKSTLRSGAHGWAPYAHRNLWFRDAHFCPNTEEREQLCCLFSSRKMQ